MYTLNETAKLKEAYASGLPVSEIAVLLDKSEKSVIGKLVNEGDYVPKAKTSKVTGEGIKTKANILAEIEHILKDTFADLDKAPKTTLVKLRDNVAGWLGDE